MESRKLLISGGKMTRQSVHFIWNEPLVVRRFESGIPLHSHTDRSREGLASVPKYAERNAMAGFALAQVSAKYRKVIGRKLDFGSSYYLPPLPPAAAYKIEASQIEALGLTPI